MSDQPEYHLAEVQPGGSTGKVESASLSDVVERATGSRRDVFKIGLAGSSLLGALGLTGCSQRIAHQSFASRIDSLVFSPDGTTLAAVGDNNVVKMWRIKESELLWSQPIATNVNTWSHAAHSLEFIPSGKHLLACVKGAVFLLSTDGRQTSKKWDTFGNSPISSLITLNGRQRFAAVLRQEHSPQNPALTLLDVVEGEGGTTLQPVVIVNSAEDSTGALHLTHDAKFVISVTTSDYIRVCDPARTIAYTRSFGSQLLAVARQTQCVCFASNSPSSGPIGISKLSIHYFGRSVSERIHKSDLATDGASSLCVSPDGRSAISSHSTKENSRAGCLIMWDIERGTSVVFGYTNHPPAVSLLVDPTGKQVAATLPLNANRGPRLQIYSLQTLKPTVEIVGEGQMTRHIFSPDGSVMATCHRAEYGSGETIKLWSTADGKYLGYLPDPAVPPPDRPPSQSSSGGSYGGRRCVCIPVRSDRNEKTAVTDVDEADVLQKLATLPIHHWRYKEEDAAVTHLGPMAQDFSSTFGLGDSDKHIHPADALGVALAAVKQLTRITSQQAQEIAELRRLVKHQE
ncbi:MAG: tail fiber domain-containing protein [Verrucomicrobiaceae bacterium]|nr:tail fiber domain-containing protein [Verrucomicrobiaceae bacterium]